MYNVSSTFLTKIKESTRNITAKLIIKGSPDFTINTNLIVNFMVEKSFGTDNIPMIGGTVSNKLTAMIVNDATIPSIISGLPIEAYVALDISGAGSYEWVKLGVFTAEASGITRSRSQIQIEAFDKMADYTDIQYTSNLTYPSKLESIIAEITSNNGIVFDNRTLYGRNLCVTQFQDWESGHYGMTGYKEAYASRVRLGGGLVDVLPSTSYYFNANSTNATKTVQFVIRTFDNNGTFVRTIGAVTNGATITFQANEYKIGVSLFENTDTVDYNWLSNAFAVGEVKPFICLASETNKTWEEFLPHIRFDTMPTGTVRQVLSWMATLLGGNATVNQDGCIDFRRNTSSGFGFDKNNYIYFNLVSDSTVSISGLQLQTSGADVISVGDSSGYVFKFDNPQITTTEKLQSVFDKAYPLNYYGYNMKSQGMPHLELGDKFSFTDINNITRELVIINHRIIFNGGMTSEFVVDIPKNQITDTSTTSGSTVEDALTKTKESFQKAILDATNLITGNKGGNLITVLDPATGLPNELVICDSSTLAGSNNVWRWNMAGLGFSSTGYNGNYELAMTYDGKINANFITTGKLTADIISTGTLVAGDNKTWINMNDGTFSFADGVISWDGTNFAIDFSKSGIGTALSGKEDSANLVQMKSYMKFSDEGMVIGKDGATQQVSIDNVSVQFLNDNAINQIPLIGLIGTGTTVTASFAQQDVEPFAIGSYIELDDADVAVYNGTYVVKTCSKTQVTWDSTATGTPTVKGTVKQGFIAHDNAVAWINGQQMYIKDLTATNSLIVGSHIIEKLEGANITMVNFIG